MNLGNDLKSIRKNKTYSQVEVASNIISQSTYSKFEAGIRDVDASIYLQLLHRLNISAEEFDYIRNDYNYGRKQKLIHTLFSLDYNHIASLHKLKQQTVNFLQEQRDEDIEEIYLICEAFIQLHDTKSIDVARNIVEPIWKEMSKYEQWYLNDIRIINTILFLFPADIAIEFTQTVLTRLNMYKDFQDAERLKIAFKINLSLILIKNKDYAKALAIIEESLRTDKKNMSYTILSLHYSREAICRANLQEKAGANPLEKAHQLLMLYDDQYYWELIQQEFNHYTLSRSNAD
ncbi:helix-turn-helix domain-containing protein [Solibacillus isronensis]|uniref:helix-turn-helix domain-containing protein n=1 Tax=Solibacillus isronensis TaxID=412383 RepID=UPI002041CCD0|nr:helix-turn-helix transcriptional regulator [Solibacillus isronensis]MCM3722990.1 helix-turn-helix domain-containing protein [Solibacillus isronensis]